MAGWVSLKVWVLRLLECSCRLSPGVTSSSLALSPIPTARYSAAAANSALADSVTLSTNPCRSSFLMLKPATLASHVCRNLYLDSSRPDLRRSGRSAPRPGYWPGVFTRWVRYRGSPHARPSDRGSWDRSRFTWRSQCLIPAAITGGWNPALHRVQNLQFYARYHTKLKGSRRSDIRQGRSPDRWDVIGGVVISRRHRAVPRLSLWLFCYLAARSDSTDNESESTGVRDGQQYRLTVLLQSRRAWQASLIVGALRVMGGRG